MPKSIVFVIDIDIREATGRLDLIQSELEHIQGKVAEVVQELVDDGLAVRSTSMAIGGAREEILLAVENG